MIFSPRGGFLCFVTFFWLLFLLGTWNQNFFSLLRGKILQCSPYRQRPRAGRRRAWSALPSNPAMGAPPPPMPPTTITTTMDHCGEVPDQAAARSRGRQGAGVLHPSHTLPPWAAGTTTTRTRSPTACRPPATGPSRRQHCAGCWRRRGRREGGGEEARGTPGGGVEYND